METFKLVVDGIDLTKEDRERIEGGIHQAMLEALAGKAEGMDFHPIVHPEGVRKITHGMPNGGILIRDNLARQELEQVMETEFGPDAELGDARQTPNIAQRFDRADLLARDVDNIAGREQPGGGAAP